MRMTLVAFIAGTLFTACKSGPAVPDVSGIKVELHVARFEKDLFSADTTDFAARLDKLQARYPSFGENFLTTILNADPKWPADSTVAYVKGFMTAYRGLYDSSGIVFRDFSPYEQEIRQALQFLKYYFPNYKAPHQIITYIGPVDGYGDILTDDAIIVGLHQHLGKDYSLYQSGLVQETYPPYMSRRFTPEYISINCMKNIVLDMFPENMAEKPLVQQMVEKGKRLFLLSKLLPYKEEYLLIGYTKEQLKDVYAHEAQVWSLFTQNNLLQSIDNNATKNYVSEGPKTPELGEAAPGNIGSFAGWQIVKKYMDKNPGTTLLQLMAKDPEQLFQESKYKP